MVTRRDGGGRNRLGVWDWHAHTAIFKIKCLPMKNKYKQNFFKDLSLNPDSAN